SSSSLLPLMMFGMVWATFTWLCFFMGLHQSFYHMSSRCSHARSYQHLHLQQVDRLLCSWYTSLDTWLPWCTHQYPSLIPSSIRSIGVFRPSVPLVTS